MSQDKIVALKEAPKIEADQDVVDMLERLLKSAKEGKVRALAFVTELTERRVGTGWAGREMNEFTMVGGCEELKLRILERYDVNELAGMLSLE